MTRIICRRRERRYDRTSSTINMYPSAGNTMISTTKIETETASKLSGQS